MTTGDELHARPDVAPITNGDLCIDMRMQDGTRTKPGSLAYVHLSSSINPSSPTEAHSPFQINAAGPQQRSSEGEQTGRWKWPEEQVD
jgi:hypothetical protein